MTWHLKDRFLEEGLCERYPDFLTALNNAAELSVGCNFVAVEFNSQLSNGDIHENHLVFEPDELKEIYEYNPRSWNKYPEVEPPRNITMLIETINFYPNRVVVSVDPSPARYFEDKGWIDSRGNNIKNVFRFRRLWG